MARTIKTVVVKRSVDAPEATRRRTPSEAISELEELRRMFIDRFGDPDEPMKRVISRRNLDAQ